MFKDVRKRLLEYELVFIYERSVALGYKCIVAYFDSVSPQIGGLLLLLIEIGRVGHNIADSLDLLYD